eukprot:NODE_1584_length_804_cov_83.413589_g1535_i0.p1 GENE.NODE_1584_length_804_cov_83.413589_g1535_i0~~NODE_1584_length_804_cov_83.413589_g1535_i0.p1  ORF type:complete len:197 (-),score=23.86 NODE_1584_length_804_cov_83.413589_g1535_i0:144-734(-)
MRSHLLLLLLCVTAIGAKKSWPPVPEIPSGTFQGIVTLDNSGEELPYLLRNNIHEQLHQDFGGKYMLAASINGSAYFEAGSEKCFKLPEKGFPFPPGFLATQNATFIGHEQLMGFFNPPAVVQHWSVAFKWVKMMFYSDMYYFNPPTADQPATKWARVTFLGGNPDHSTVVMSFNKWNFTVPTPEEFVLPPYCPVE